MQGNRTFATGNSAHAAQTFATEALLKKLHTATPVRVVKTYQDDETGIVKTVDVMPLLAQVDGEGRTWEPSTLYRQPFMRIQGGENAVIVNPKIGDLGLSVFADRDCSVVANTRKDGQPGSPRIMDAADGFYLGGFLNGAAKRFVLINDDGVEIEGVASLKMHGKTTIITAEAGCTINADVPINGNLTWTGSAQGQGGAAKFAGGLTNTGGVMQSNSVTLDSHTHTGVQRGGDNTGGPQ